MERGRLLMAHCGSLNAQLVSDHIHDVRSATVRGSDGKKLGNVDDLIFDHDTMQIHYLVVDSGSRGNPECSSLPDRTNLRVRTGKTNCRSQAGRSRSGPGTRRPASLRREVSEGFSLQPNSLFHHDRKGGQVPGCEWRLRTKIRLFARRGAWPYCP